MQPKAYLAAALTTAALMTLAGCGGSSDNSAKSPSSKTTSVTTSAKSTSTPTGGSQPSTASVVITIKDFKFNGPASVKPGASITIKNEDNETHSVTADSGGAFNVTVNAGSSATLTAPSKPGSYPYHCSFHAEMHGTLVVK